MATGNKIHATVDDDADDEDLEALRLAALQTLRVNKPPIAVSTNKVQLHHRAMGSTGARGLYRGGISRARPGRNNVFQRHRVNSNLIAIVPVSEDSTVGNSGTESKTAGRSTYSDSPAKLILPQDRYCKTGSSQITNEEHAVTSKFTRYEDYNSNSSAEESDEGEGSSIAKNVVATVEEPENDPDVLVMGAEDEDSLEKLMDELEEEINRSETDVPMRTMQFSKILDQPSTHEEKMVQHKKTLDGAKAKDFREKEVVDKTHTNQGKNSEDPWGKDKMGILAQGNKQSKAAGCGEQVNLEEVHDKAESIKSSKDGDLRTELSRRRAERLTKAGSLHEKLPARLVQSAFEGVMGKKNTKHVEREEKHLSSKQGESKKEKSDVRRVLVLKRPAVERRVASISVTIPKESKRDCSPPPAKLPIRMRLGLPSIGTGSPPEERLSSRRRNRKMKLKRNVMLGNNKV